MAALNFKPGQRLTAAALNELVRLATGRVEATTGNTAPPQAAKGHTPHLPLNVGGQGRSVGILDGVPDALQGYAGVLAPGVTTPDGGRVAPTSSVVTMAGPATLYQITTTDFYGTPTGTWLSPMPVETHLWSGLTSGIICRPVAEIKRNPSADPGQAAYTGLTFYVETYADAMLPVVPVDAAATSSVQGVPMVGSRRGNSVPIKRLSAGHGITLTDNSDDVTVSLASGIGVDGVTSVQQYTSSPLPEPGVNGWVVTAYQPMVYTAGDTTMCSYRQLMRVSGGALQVSHQRAIYPDNTWAVYFKA